MANLIVSAVSQWNGKALKKGQKDVSAFDKSVKKLGKTFASVFAAQKIAQFGKASVQAFLADEAAATRLSQAVKNLGLSLSNVDIQDFITKLESQTGIVDDKLRPAFQALLTTTGDVVKSQEILNSAIDISRGSGVELATVSQDLANGYVGITRGLKKYNLGLTQSQLKTKSFKDLMVLMNKQFSGASAAYLETYSGKMDKITVATENAKEIIGKGLIDSLLVLSGDTTISDLADDIQKTADGTAALLVNIAKLTKALIAPIDVVAGSLAWFITHTQKYVDLIVTGDPSGFMSKPTVDNSTGRRFNPQTQYAQTAKERQAAQAKILADAKNLAIQKELNKIAAAKALKDRMTAQAAKTALLFNQNAISITAALKGKLSDEERNKLLLMLAIETDNVDEATKLAQKVAMATDATGALALFLRTLPDAKNPFEYLDVWLKSFQEKLDLIRFPTPPPYMPLPDSYVPKVYPEPYVDPGDENFIGPVVPTPNYGLGGSRGDSAASVTNISLTVNNPMGNDGVSMVQNAVMDAIRLGNNLYPAGSLV